MVAQHIEETAARTDDVDASGAQTRREAIRRAVLAFRLHGTSIPRRILFDEARAALRSWHPPSSTGFLSHGQLCAYLRHAPQYSNYDTIMSAVRAAGATDDEMTTVRRLLIARIVRGFGLHLTPDCVALNLGDIGQRHDVDANAHLELALLARLGIW